MLAVDNDEVEPSQGSQLHNLKAGDEDEGSDKGFEVANPLPKI